MSTPTPSMAPARSGVLSRLEAIGPPMLYGLRLSCAVGLALFVAFTLELDDPSWAGTSAAIVCQPVLGASLRKGFFRLIGTVIGATMAVVLTGVFPQNRAGFLFAMALWAAGCAFAGTLMRNFAAYAAMLSGYTLAIIAGDSISAPDQVFHLAVTRASEISIGIVSATLVMGLTDLGHAPRSLAAALDRIVGDIRHHVADLLSCAGGVLPDGSPLRRNLIRQVAALDPLIDQAIGESPELRHRKPILRATTAGLFSALSGWRIVESHLRGLAPDEAHRRGAEVAARSASGRNTDRPEQAQIAPDVGRAVDASRVSQRLLADAAARVASGLSAAENGLTLLRDPAAARDPPRGSGFVIADALPALVNAIRVFVAIGAAILFWIATSWPNGLTAITFIAVTVLLLSPQQEKSGPAALGFGAGTLLAAGIAAAIDFAVLPNHESFLSLALIMASVLLPLAALSTVPTLAPWLVPATMNFVPLLGPSNQITFDTVSFANGALAIVGGCAAGAIALSVIPPLPTEIRADRLLSLTLRDLRRMAAGRRLLTPETWESRVDVRLVALPDDVDPAYGLRLVAALSVGLQVIRLRKLSRGDPLRLDIAAALRDLSVGNLRVAMSKLDDVDRLIAARVLNAGPDQGTLHDPAEGLRIRTAIQVIRDVLPRHGRDFERQQAGPLHAEVRRA